MEKKKLNIPNVEWQKTKKAGVVFLESMKGGYKHKVYYIRFRHRGGVCPSGKRCGGHFEKVETADTPSQADSVRQDRIRGKESTNEERRETIRAEKQAEASMMTFNKLWECWKSDPENKGKRGTLKADLRYKKHLKEKFGEREPSELLPIDIERLRLSLADNYSRETVKSILGLITRLSRYGQSGVWQGKGVNRVCVTGLSFPIILKGKKGGKDPKTKRAPNAAEISAFEDACKAWPNVQEGNFCLFIRYTGIRRGSAWDLKWQDVDLGNKRALLRDSKTGDVPVYLSDDTVSLLKSHPRTKGNLFVFTGNGPGGKLTQRQINIIPREIANAAKWTKELDPCHSWRRNLASILHKRGFGTKTIQAAGGWKSPQMVLHYTSVEEETVRVALNALGNGNSNAEDTA